MDFSTKPQAEEPQVDISLDLFLQELDIVFRTAKGSVFGNRDFGNSTERLLWKTTFNDSYVKVSIAEEIKKSCFMHEYYNWTVDVKLLRGSHRDIALIDIVIQDKLTDDILATKKFQFR